jgi:hypothetical protein
MCVMTATSLLVPVSLASATNAVIAHRDAVMAIGRLAAILIVGALGSLAVGVAEPTSLAGGTAWLGHRLLRHMISLGERGLAEFPPGDMTSRLLDNVPAAANAGPSALEIALNLVTSLGAVAALWLTDWVLGAVFLFAAGPAIMMMRASVRAAPEMFLRCARAQGRIAARLGEALDGIRVRARPRWRPWSAGSPSLTKAKYFSTELPFPISFRQNCAVASPTRSPAPASLGKTVADDIGYGSRLIARTDIERAARMARAHDFIRGCRTDMTRLWPIRRFPAGSGSGSVSPGPSRRTRAYSYSTTRPQAWTRQRKRRSTTRSGNCERTGPRSSWLTGAGTAARADTVVWLHQGRVRGMAPHERLWRDPAYRAIFSREPPLAASLRLSGRR